MASEATPARPGTGAPPAAATSRREADDPFFVRAPSLTAPKGGDAVLGAGTLTLSAEGAVSVNDLTNPPSREFDFNQMLAITRGRQPDISAAFRFNVGLKYEF